MIRVLIIHMHDPAISHVGGLGTFINTFVKYAPSDFEVSLIGVSSEPEKRPVGQWQEVQISGRTLKYLPIVNAHPTYHGRFPLSVRFVWALNHFRPRIDFKGAILEFHRIEPEMVLRDRKNLKVLFYHTHPRDVYNPKTEIFWKKFPWAYFLLEGWLIKNMQQLYAVREDVIEWLRAKHALKMPFRFLPTWADEEVFKSLPDPEREKCKKELAEQYGIDLSAAWLLYVGRFELQKDPMLLLESFAKLQESLPQTRLVMIGGGSLEADIRAFIEKRNLTGEVHLIGPQPQSVLAKWMNASGLLCLTSAYEGMPRVVNEAFQCGLPAVSFDDEGGVRHVIQDQDPAVGRLVKERTPEAFSEAFAAVLKQVPDRAACLRAVAPYGAKKILETLFEDYRRLAKGF